MSSSSYKVNDVVWVRYGDYPWWPSVVFPLHMATAEHKQARPRDKRAIMVRFFDPDGSVAWPTPRDLRPWNCKKAEKYKKNKEVQSSVREAEAFIRDGKKVEDEYKEAAGPSASSSDEDDDDSEEDSDDGDQNDVNKEQDHKQTEEDGDDKDDDDNNADGNEEEEIEDSSMAKTSEVPKKMNKKLVKGDKKINGKKESEQATESVAVATEQDEQEKRPFDNDVDNDEGHARKGRRLKSLAEVDAEDDDEEDDDVEDDDRHREEANEQDRDYDEEEDDNDGDDSVDIKPKKKKKKKREKNSIARDNHEGRKYDSHNDENKKKRRRQSTGPATNSSSSSGEKSKRRKRNGKQKITSIVNAKDEKNEYSSTKRKRKMGLTSKTTTMPTALQKKRKKQKSGGEKKRAKERVTPGTEMQQQNISSKNHTNKIDIDDSPHSSPHRVGMEEFEEEIGIVGGGGISEMRNLQSKLKNKLELVKKKAKAAQVKKRKLREQRDELKERLQELSRKLKQLTEENDYNEKMMSQREKSPSARLPQSPLQQEKQQPPSSKLVNSDPSNPIKKEKGEQTENSKDVDEGKMQVTNEEGHTDDIPAAGTSTANNGDTGSSTSAVKARDAETSTPVDPKFKKGEMVLYKGVMARVEGVHNQSESYTLDCGNGRTPNVPFGSANIKSPHHSKNTSHSSITTKIGDQDKKDEDEKIAVTAQNTNSPTENTVDEKEQNIENEDNEKEGKEPGTKMTMAVSSSSNSNIVNGGEDTSGKMETEENEKEEKSNNAEDVKAKIENQSS